ncbi:MAG TPA: hypothetical protein VJ782_07805 [Aeromicrobium sp.]|nr:hypothetical protein [Aeromicrobium sp.]
MSEVEALLRLYGAIDRAVAAREADAADLAPLLGPYRDGAATGWYDGQYQPWLEGAKARAEERRRAGLIEAPDLAHVEGVDAPPPGDVSVAYADEPPQPEPDLEPEFEPTPEPLSPPAQEIYDALLSFEPVPLEGRVPMRRLLAVTAAARAMPEHFGPDGTHAEVSRRALHFTLPDSDSGSDAARAQDLHRRFAEEFTAMPAWPDVVNAAVAAKQLPDEYAGHADAPPCTGRLIMRPDADGTDSDPCLVMEAGFITDAVSFAVAKDYLEPENWEYPDSLWCRMDKGKSAGTNTWVYHETVATSCPATAAYWTVSTDLQFWFSHPTATEARVEYDFPDGWPLPYSDIEIDEGSLRVIELPDKRVEVKTTKRVRFAGAFDGAGLAMFMCAIGYSSVLEDMVFSATKSTYRKPFPLQFPQGAVMSPPPNVKKAATKTAPAKATAANKAGASATAGGESLEDIVNEASKFAASFLKGCADTATESMKHVQEGKYKVEDAWADGIKLWTTSMAGLAKAFDLGMRGAKAFAEKSEN